LGDARFDLQINNIPRGSEDTVYGNGLFSEVFVFDEIASLAGSADARDVDPQILSDICKGLWDENPYCIELRFLGAEARERAEGIIVVPRMTNQPTHFDACSVMNNRQTGEMKLQVETHSHSVSNVSLDSEKVEVLCFPLLFCHGEPGYTNESKSHLSPDEYAMARLLRPVKSVSGYMTAHAGYAPLQYLHPLKLRVKLKSISCKVF